MRELRFPKEVYPGAHVDAAMKVYARFGEFEREESETHWVVRITSGSRAKERRLAGAKVGERIPRRLVYLWLEQIHQQSGHTGIG